MQSTLMDGVLLTGPQFLGLARAASMDGSASGTSTHPKSSGLEVESRAAYSDLLTALLISGKAIVTVPPYMADVYDAPRLRSEGLIEFHQADFSSDLLSTIAPAYEKAFRKFRKLENHPKYSPFLSIERQIGRRVPMHSVELSDIEAEINFQLKRFSIAHNSVVDFLGDIFGSVFDTQKDLYFGCLSDVMNKQFGKIKKSESARLCGKETSGRDLRSILGLEVRSAALFDAGAEQFSYLPMDLLEFKELDHLLTGGFMGVCKELLLLTAEMTCRLDRSEFLRTHAHFKTVFELYDLMKFSAMHHCPLYVPGPIAGKPAEARSSRCTSVLQDQSGLYKIFLSERGYVPKLDSIDTLLRLREDKRLRPLMQTIHAWEEELQNSDVTALDLIRRDLDKAQREIRKLGNLVKLGQYISYASIPIGVADMLMMTPFSLVSSVVGVALDIKARFGLERFSWFNFGT